MTLCSGFKISSFACSKLLFFSVGVIFLGVTSFTGVTGAFTFVATGCFTFLGQILQLVSLFVSGLYERLFRIFSTLAGVCATAFATTVASSGVILAHFLSISLILTLASQ